ncbi:MAG: hypothetical protein PHY47_00725 [Lachnospiraceae bacterium]|nr:hypothetical protein [Lachnospiraceae bacterium]
MTKQNVIKDAVEPGDTAKCKVTQIEGIVVVRHDYLYGVPRIGIQPQGSFEGKQHETIHLDLPQAELIKKNTVSRDGMIPVRRINLGDECKDEISGFKGICTGVAEWLYACSKIMIQPQKLDSKKYAPAEPFWFDEPQVKLVKVEKLEPKQKNTGGFGKSVYSDNRHSSNTR